MRKKIKYLVLFSVVFALLGCTSFNDKSKVESISIRMTSVCYYDDVIDIVLEWTPSNLKLDESDFDIVIVEDVHNIVVKSGSTFRFNDIGTFSFYATTGTVFSEIFQITVRGNPISTQEDMQNICTNLDGIYELKNNIVLSGEWLPIGSEDAPFEGKLYGNGYIISNITINNDNKYNGLFGSIGKNGFVTNFSVSDVYIIQDNCGSIAGINYGFIYQVSASGQILVSSGANIGGIAGLNYGGISECISSVTISTYAENVGGIAGFFKVPFLLTAIFETMYGGLSNEGNISGVKNIGGIFGQMDSITNTSKSDPFKTTVSLVNFINEGSVSGEENVGGIIGYANGDPLSENQFLVEIVLSNSVNRGSVDGDECVGGIVGFSSNEPDQIDDSENSGNVSGLYYVGGIVGRADGNIISACLNSGSISGEEYVGGIAGSAYVITNSENTGTVNSTGP